MGQFKPAIFGGFTDVFHVGQQAQGELRRPIVAQ